MQKLKNYYHFVQAFVGAIYYGFPARKLKIIGITGTSGKTTTTHMIYEILKAAGKKVSLISTIAAIIDNKEYDTGFHVTTPDPIKLQQFLKLAVESGSKYFVLEVSSHALDQNRVAFVNFDIGVLTTLAHEHLDYHKTLEQYTKAKFKLLNDAKKVVINRKIKYFNYSNNYSNKVIKRFGLDEGEKTTSKWKLKLTLPGEYNLLNALAGATVGHLLGISNNTIGDSLNSFRAIPGRFEEVYAGDFRVIIDFAHKPDALEQVLKTARNLLGKEGRIIVMYGCASERDTLKRPIMGAISGRLADITVLTDEDPRWESSEAIIKDIANGCIKAGAIEVKNLESKIKNSELNSARNLPRFLKGLDLRANQGLTPHYFIEIPNRQEAINFIIRTLVKKGDIVLLCGKGHEQSINYKGVETPWSEHDAVKKALYETS